MPNLKNQIVTTIESDEELIIKPRKIPKDDFGYFSMIRSLRTMRNESYVDLDLVDILVSLPKGAQKLFNEIKFRMEFTMNFSIYVSKHQSRSEQVIFNRTLAELIKNNLIKKIPKHLQMQEDLHIAAKYIINPHLIKPNNYEAATKLWAKL